ncbi:MAG TPA: sterol desaturase family protein [Bacteroidia bacterium]|nr:sterol desaturase family protein [Bacteroidia bacterium]
MTEFKISNEGTTRLFNNPVLERLTRTPFALPVVFYFLVALAATIYYSEKFNPELLSDIFLFVSGMICFTLVEYIIHRFVFHFHATSERQREVQYSIHGVHHQFPKDKDRLVMPPVLSILLAGVFYFLFRLIFSEQGLMFFAGFSAGYSAYLLIHYAVHKFHPPKNFFRFWWKHHSLHHYYSNEASFSVSFPLWDILFGTMPKKKSPPEVQDSSENLLPDGHVE